jgi:hypothetical protein
MFLYGFYDRAMNTNQSIRPFTVTIAQADLDDLNARLARTRLPGAAPGDDWDYGTPNHYLGEMVDRWQNGFDWRAQEARMNEFPHYLTEIDGQTVHFIHVPSEVEGARWRVQHIGRDDGHPILRHRRPPRHRRQWGRQLRLRRVGAHHGPAGLGCADGTER